MKFRILMKDPDGVFDAVEEAVRKQVDSDIPKWMSALELEGLFERRMEEVQRRIGKWFDDGEYLEVEVDLDRDTCTVVEPK